MIAVLASAGVTGAPASAEPEAGLRWGPCPEEARATAAECAEVSVPLHYSDPGGARIPLTISRIAAAGPARGVLFGNPGGPGGDALGFWTQLNQRVPQLRAAQFDQVAVQPRGLRWSQPLDCSSPLDGLPLTFQLTCDSHHPGYARTITTENMARDLDQVRLALGVERVSFLGVSWGTYLGAVYATLFPQHTDKLVLDSNVDPDRRWAEQFAQIPAGVSRRLAEFTEWAATQDGSYGLGDTAAAVRDQWNRQVAAQGGGMDAPTLAATTFAAYSRNSWPYLAQGMREYRDDPSRTRFLDFLAKPALAAHATSGWTRDAVECNEDGRVDGLALLHSLATLGGTDPYVQQESLLRTGAACLGWPGTTARIRVDGSALAVRPLLVQSHHDPATQASGAVALAAATGGTVLWVDGGDHAQFGRRNPTVDDTVLEYLRSGTVAHTTAPEPPLITPSPPAEVPAGR
ncbi:alpha/beta fold hydrolase [Nocardia sp. NPDC050435]|uniref:alpha/beta fold hydrolase n=1 Tax=Nocardia sp. NPDC050435 TaxID=3155040 RepID=UPI0033FEB162